MPLRLSEIHLNLTEDETDLPRKASSLLEIEEASISSFRIIKKSLDARKKDRIAFVYTVEIETADEAEVFRRNSDKKIKLVEKEIPSTFPRLSINHRPIVIGTGPAGLFAALRLTEYGLNPILLERGQEVGRRVGDVERFWNGGGLNPESNVQFGEGGAGTFSDGKLTTRVDDPRISYILRTLVAAGAQEEILYQAKPHVGTDRLRGVVINIRKRLISLGCEVHFGSKVTGFGIRNGKIETVTVNDKEEVKAGLVVLAVGNSARDTYESLHRAGVSIERKPFAIGCRIEHPQQLIDRIQYGRSAGHPRLPAAEYVMTHNMPERNRSAYTFCMCPGGSVIAASSELERLVVNGMSLSGRDSGLANSAVVVTVRPEDFNEFGDGPLSGIAFQRRWEEEAFVRGGGNYNAPAQGLREFLGSGKGSFNPSRCSYRPGVTPSDLARCLPGYVVSAMREALLRFDAKMKGFISDNALLIGVETRTSAPVRITRGTDYQSINTKGLYPCGEGAGYAGGIISSALDGIRAADAIFEDYSSVHQNRPAY